jgi:hypothetical protein
MTKNIIGLKNKVSTHSLRLIIFSRVTAQFLAEPAAERPATLFAAQCTRRLGWG